MPYDLFWHGPISAYLQFRAANSKRIKERHENENRVAWLHGAYITRAIASAFDNEKNPYPQKPIVPLTPEQEEKRQALEDSIKEHNEKMRKISEQQTIKLQQKLSAQIMGAESDGKRADN